MSNSDLEDIYYFLKNKNNLQNLHLIIDSNGLNNYGTDYLSLILDSLECPQKIALEFNHLENLE